MPHLQDDYEERWWMTVEYKSGEVTVTPLEEGARGFPFQPKGMNYPHLNTGPLDNVIHRSGLDTLHEITMTQGWCSRLSAPGYVDCTDWLGPYESIEQATEALDEVYGAECCYCAERVGTGNADAPCEGCYEDVSWQQDGLSCMSIGVVIIADQVWTARWAEKWPCSTLSHKWVTFAYDNETGVTFDDCGGGSEFIDSREAQAMADDVHDIVREHYKEVSA
tara:strand:+ start:405 stop:1067 length:663 start_codon:yes stop_codon:yes gene_type:complete